MADSPHAGKISADKLCQLTGYTDRRHRQIADKGYFPQPLRGEYQTGPTIAGLFRYLKEEIHKKDDSEKKAEARLKNAKADMAEDERDRNRKLWILKSEIGPALRNVSLHQRAVLQRKFENEVAPKLAGLKTPEILARVKAAVDEICALFQSGCRAWMDSPSPGGEGRGEGGLIMPAPAPPAPVLPPAQPGQQPKRPQKKKQRKPRDNHPHPTVVRKPAAKHK